MIPLAYRLRESVRLEPSTDDSWRVLCASPLVVVKVNSAAARLLEGTRSGASIEELSADLCIAQGKVFALCEYFRDRGILEAGEVVDAPSFMPSVTVVIPTRDRASDLAECLHALSGLDYPRDRVEVIVVDDGSEDPATIAEVVARRGARLLINERNRGPSYSRNRAAREAAGEILAFVDSDCVVSPGWLRELTPYFFWDRVGAVGGRTVGCSTESLLDRYEEVASPLDMGKRLLLGTGGRDQFYVPTCNLLVRHSVYHDVGGLREELLVGEDVDFCWRLRDHGVYLVYAAAGVVRHKHREHLGAMLRQRASYGTSEAVLHALHPERRKRFPLAPAPLATVALVSAAAIGREPWLLPTCLVPSLWDAGRRTLRLRRSGVNLAARHVCSSVARGHLSMLYFVYFHLVRYYLGPLAALGLFSSGIRLLSLLAILYSSAVDYESRKPRMGYVAYLGYYLAEHAAYQAGVLEGCVRARTFRSYLPVLQPDRPWRTEEI